MKHPTIPDGSWPALLRLEYAAAYVGEASTNSFLSRVGTLWPKPWQDIGNKKGRYRVWRKSDLDAVIDPPAVGPRRKFGSNLPPLKTDPEMW
jgi:hypothetical protein